MGTDLDDPERTLTSDVETVNQICSWDILDI